jgi:hypothetical protein
MVENAIVQVHSLQIILTQAKTWGHLRFGHVHAHVCLRYDVTDVSDVLHTVLCQPSICMGELCCLFLWGFKKTQFLHGQFGVHWMKPQYQSSKACASTSVSFFERPEQDSQAQRSYNDVTSNEDVCSVHEVWHSGTNRPAVVWGTENECDSS